ncbi:hypothetical protein BASA50_009971 [Batrachochytrium salamandrivorans]|uniref:Uncharacterized protein n=1 Tax=Batrachochytrium salamandrivorans TaxID=1357716 RepID=A0ABQ8F0D1_9FUNG|nr:hypothetical protein BASA50_009971 [Batrachochytrium salamandrivorans]KAH6600551.1 hypothetical protein BASA61_002261 [Batrachochytrium salamandrivorans]KAH9246166.1 hypothetical protein BASA81_016307 [Batrachochytrium salamandrivorans]KAH9270568.1 hypothetical protein BASA83_007381 [Batrachochytrium salamandrivorans]
MRLISFAVISLLAITVSAHPPLSTSATNDAPQCDKDVIKHKIRELTAVYPAQKELIKTLETPGKAEREEREIKSVMKTIEEQLKRTDLPERERLSLEKHYTGSVEDLEKAESALVAKQKQLEEAKKQRYGMEVKLDILEENLALKEEQDAKSKGRVETSSGSKPHRKILGEQIDETCPNAEDLFDAYNDLKEGIFKLDDVRKSAKNHKKKLELSKTRDKFMGTSDNLVGEFIFARYKCDHAKELQTEFGWQLQSSLTWGVVQSVWQIFSK